MVWLREILRELERNIPVFRNFASFIDRELNLMQHVVYHLEGRRYDKRNQLERKSRKLKLASYLKLYSHLLHFSRF